MEKQKSFLTDLSREKPESFQEEVFVPAKKKPLQILIPIAVVIAVLALIYLLYQAGEVTVPDMSQWQLQDVQDWMSKHHENTELNGVYTKDTAENKVISQSIQAGRRIGKDITNTVTYSLGADPEEQIEIPDIKNMTLTEIKTWIEDNQMKGVSVKYETSDIVAKDNVINYEFVEGSEDEFLRKNRMVIYVSSGSEDLGETFLMPDFYGKTKADAIQWAENQQVKVKYKEEFNPDVEFGKIYDQSIKKDTKITRTDSVVLSVSRGTAILVPDFTGMSRSEASEFAALYKMNIYYKLVISEGKADTVISQDVEAGSQIDQKQVITLQIAKEEGKATVPDFKGLTQAEANSLAGLYNIKVFLQNTLEAGENGIVAAQSIASGNKIDNNQIITLSFKKNGKMVSVPDFKGLSKNEAAVLAKNRKLDVVYNEVETAKSPNQTIISQSLKAKQQVGEGESILLTIAVNSGVRADNLRKLSLKEAQAWAAQNGITLNVIETYSNDHAVGKIYEQDCAPEDWIPVNKVLTVYYSLGLVMVDDFTGKTKSDILAWRDEVNEKGADISLSFLDDTDTVIKKGLITRQSISEDLVKPGQAIQVWVSATDNGVLMKNFENMDLEDFKFWCDTNSVPYVVTDCYSDTYEEGKLFGQNYINTYVPKGEYLKINHSLGKVYVKDFTNQTKSDVVEWQREVNKKMGNISITFVNEYSQIVERGRIIGQSAKDEEIALDGSFIVYVSIGG